VSAPSRRGDFFLDIPFNRTSPISAFYKDLTGLDSGRRCRRRKLWSFSSGFEGFCARTEDKGETTRNFPAVHSSDQVRLRHVDCSERIPWPKYNNASPPCASVVESGLIGGPPEVTGNARRRPTHVPLRGLRPTPPTHKSAKPSGPSPCSERSSSQPECDLASDLLSDGAFDNTTVRTECLDCVHKWNTPITGLPGSIVLPVGRGQAHPSSAKEFCESGKR